jgi:peptide/nickel transport system ATP-binding protein
MSLLVNIQSAFYQNKQILSDISFKLQDGGMLAIVGESGAGKTTVAKIVSGLYKQYNLKFDGYVKTDKKIAFIPQNISDALDPLFSIEYQMREIKNNLNDIRNSLNKVGFDDIDRVLKSYPHNLSGGMRQRVLIAMALLDGDIIIADEFTSALDRTTKLQIVELFRELNKKFNTTIIFITHDIELLDFEGEILVMFMGELVEYGASKMLIESPYHPYMRFLRDCVPQEGMHYRKNRFQEIEIDQDAKCPFVAICDRAKNICYDKKPQINNKKERLIRCHF